MKIGRLHGFTVRESCLLVFADSHRGPTIAGRFSFAPPHRNYGFVRVRIDIEAVVAGLQNGKRLVRSVNLVALVVVKAANVQVERALVQLQLNAVFVDVSERQTAFRVDPDQPSTHADFCTRVLVRPNVVGIRERTIQTARNPIVRPVRLNRNRAGHKLQPGSSRWGVGLVLALRPGNIRAGGRP